MSLPEIEVLIEELLPKILRRLGKENPSKNDAKLHLYSASALWRRQFRYDFYTLRTTSPAKISVCMQGSCECCPYVYAFWNYLPEFLRHGPVHHHVLLDVTGHFNWPFGNLPGFEPRRVIHKKLFGSSSIILATLILWWEFPLNFKENLPHMCQVVHIGPAVRVACSSL